MQSKVATLLLVALLATGTEARWLSNLFLGGPRNELPANGEVRAMVKQVESEIRKIYPNGFKSIEPLAYKTQVVAGTNYIIRARLTGEDDKQAIVHLRIWKNLAGQLRFENIRTKVDARTPLSSFMKNDI